MEAIEGLRYRARDALKAVTRFAVREARRKELHDEILASEKVFGWTGGGVVEAGWSRPDRVGPSRRARRGKRPRVGRTSDGLTSGGRDP